MNFVDVLGGWVNRYFSRPDAIFLISALLVISLALYTLAGALAPVLTGLVLAFLLEFYIRQFLVEFLLGFLLQFGRAPLVLLRLLLLCRYPPFYCRQFVHHSFGPLVG